jgi:uncharacterized membrane protein YhdT
MKRMTYREKFLQMDKEAIWTCIVVGVICAFWWFAGSLSYTTSFKILHMPGWYVTGAFGTLILSILGAIFLVKRIFVDFEFDEEETDASERDASRKF